ncbi:MAG: ATP-binding protein [Rickettsiales bacterium]|nr:ATP-binding protein [Rickettsiales bacterium]
MPLDSWLPVDFELPDQVKLKQALHEGPDWQIYSLKGGDRALVAKASLAQKWLDSNLIDDGFLLPFQFGSESYFSISSAARHNLSPVEESPSPRSKSEALAFAHALKATRERDAVSPLQDSIYVEKISRLLPTFTLSDPFGDDVVLGFYLSGGVPVSTKSIRRLKSLTTWLGADNLQEVINKAGIRAETTSSGEATGPARTGKFSLAGRHELEQFLNEHVIDIIENSARYKAMGIDFPSAIILHGPPGCGKTFAVEKLVEYLEWPSFHIEASSVASPFIHETSKKVAEVFNNAMQNAPAIIVIDEMEAFLSSRQNSGSQGTHHVEEVAEFLRRIPEAIKNQVMVVGMTNCLEMIDPAILRRGRFDHVIKVDMASEQEINDLFNKLIDGLPHEDSIDIASIAKELKNRPLSDVAFIVRESARLAARSGADKINQECLVQALESSPARTGEPPARKIGFM